ncbi:alpha/beta fold hydrolase [Conexibacter sp. JD483]|uniref:alpha/beta fold hydrolase n=1 Tax=unclassified Conexibacter TaxID=2627773 RepID=UPI00271A9D28|nr:MULTISPECIES: alpha/beta fold hydrolase [unclassified Conexibacter]MDO8185998.1 alpha/beta fold hydrolase [Conexibacter sp. CPCC 205706]MDO8199488.1 alpha/beta fold hydrolase [Conexibacter sp. CPCC 205762]MDR9368977.1 alpha/beta fold hydrolase [Conexibacter sp. JD483]
MSASRARVGHEPKTGLYYELLGPQTAAGPPLLLIHGGGATGACWRATPDGRLGWADQLADRGHRLWVTDWPGTGRSGNRDGLEIDYAAVVEGYRTLLRETIAEPVVVVCHSMGGAVAWQLVEHESDLVAGVLSVAGAYPANVAPRSQVVSDDGAVAVVDFADTGVRMTVDRRVMNLYGDGYVYQQGIATSTRFPLDRVDAMRAGFVGLPPRMLLQRLGVEPGMPTIDSGAGFAGTPIRLLASAEDPAHTRAIEERTLGLLRGWGAEAELIWLPDLGIEGNGHFMMFEQNSDELLEVVATQLTAVGAVAR